MKCQMTEEDETALLEISYLLLMVVIGAAGVVPVPAVFIRDRSEADSRSIAP